LPQELEHILHVGGRLAIIAKQSLAAAALIESWEGLVNAKRERLAVVAAEKDEGIAADERRYVLSLPAAFLGDVKILIGTNASTVIGITTSPVPPNTTAYSNAALANSAAMSGTELMFRQNA
jgi:hypothetical protein